MKLIELYYKAFRLFRKHTRDDENSQKLRNAISHSNHEKDIFTTIRYECKIDIDWVENIEEGLDFVRKAINEERQFIRSEGEVVPIEKVKKVSKSSIEHLSRHSNFITRLPEDKSFDVIPEKLYIVEKLSDFQVYENRFLYMLLCYVKDFVELRLNNMRDKTATYQSLLTMDKNIEDRSRNIQYKLDYKDIIRNDPYLQEQFHDIPLANRVENIYAIAVSLLATPLMKEVSKAPMIKPPVIKTNVLRMNPNFKAALKLYDYISAYNTDGYEIVEAKKTYQPFTPEMSDEIAETVEITSFIGYINGIHIKDILEKQVTLEEAQKQQEQSQQKIDELQRLKKRVVEMHEDPSEYMYMLEKRNAELEKENLKLAVEQDKNKELTSRINELLSEQQALEDSVSALNQIVDFGKEEIDRINQMYYADIGQAEMVHQQELKNQEDKHLDVIEVLKQEQRKATEALHQAFDKEREQLHAQQEKDKQYIVDKYEERAAMTSKEIYTLEQTIASLNALIERHKGTINQRNLTIEKLEDEINYANARYLALRTQQGLLTKDDDFTSKEHFKQLEKEMRAYKKMFRQQWKQAKRKIRAKVKEETLGTAPPKKKRKKDQSNQTKE